MDVSVDHKHEKKKKKTRLVYFQYQPLRNFVKVYLILYGSGVFFTLTKIMFGRGYTFLQISLNIDSLKKHEICYYSQNDF